MAIKIKVKMILELLSSGMSQREIARSRKVSRGSISSVSKLAKELGVTYDQIKNKTESEVYKLFFPDKFITEQLYKYPDYAYIHKELKRTGVTLKLLWQEYQDQCDTSKNIAMGYTKFCEGYTVHVRTNHLTNHLYHKPGETCEVDWGGKTMPIISPETGEIIKAYLFVATLPYSQYSYVEACLDMKQNAWLKCHVNMFNFFTGSTVRIVCDNLKTGVIKHPRQGDIVLNKQYEEFGEHYLTAIMPAGVRKPKQKASVEGTVGKIATAIIARLRHDEFHTLDDLNKAIRHKLQDFNDAPFQKREGSRSSIFFSMEKPHLKTLPPLEYEVAEWSYGHIVNLNCHVIYKTNHYSVPYQYIGKKVSLKITDTRIEIFFNQERLCIHTKRPDYDRYMYTTVPDHMPDQFQRPKWDDERIKKWASSIGIYTRTVIERVFESVKIKEQGYQSALSVLNLSKKFPQERLEIACGLALENIHSPRYRHLKTILDAKTDQVHLEKQKHQTLTKPKGYLRGKSYYNGGEK